MIPSYPIWDPRFKYSPSTNVLQRFRDAGFRPPGDRDEDERREAAIRAVRGFEAAGR